MHAGLRRSPTQELRRCCMTDLASLEARLERLEDLEQITRLFHSYRMLVDDKEFEACAQQLFSEDASFIGEHGRHVGREAILRMFESMIGVSVREKKGDDEHIFADPVIEIDGERAAVNIAWAYFVRSELGTPLLLKNGHHEDTVVKVNGEWKIQEVRAFTDIYK
jgi:SnoaL-like domain